MIPRPRSIVRAALVVISLLSLLTFAAHPARAIQLRWSTGATDLTVTENTRAELLVQADSAEVTLPPTWRLIWTANSSCLQFAALDSALACQTDTAQVFEVDLPSTPADSAANLVTTHLCSAGSEMASSAYSLVDIVGGSQGKIKVVALDPADSTNVIESNEVTYNGGVDGDYAPLILLAERTHVSSQLMVSAIGVGLDSAAVVQIAAPDTSWTLALNVTERTPNTLSATAQVAADLPPFVLRVGGGSTGGMGVASLAADTALAPAVLTACVGYMREYTTGAHIQPKDFAFVASRDSFHIFYIRHDMLLSTDATEKSIGHKCSQNLNDWFPSNGTMTAIQVRSGMWDDFHVWAPTIFKKPNDITYYMLYTGVRDTVISGTHCYLQRIGVATSTDLNVWVQDTAWVYAPNYTSWAEPNPATYSGQQFRDPFLMAAPDTAGQYLMYFIAGPKDRKDHEVVGVARCSDGNLRHWRDERPLWNTDAVHTGATAVESPHVFQDHGDSWCLYYTGARGYGDSSYVCFETSTAGPIADTTYWGTPDTLYRFIGGDDTIQRWHASEYLKLRNGYEYLAAFDDEQVAVSVAQISWHGPHVFALNDSCPPVSPLGVDPGRKGPHLGLTVLGASPARGRVDFGVDTPTRMHVRLAVYDVVGRRVRTIMDGEVAGGRLAAQWDGRSASGDVMSSGIYFARLTTAAGQRVARVVLLR